MEYTYEDVRGSIYAALTTDSNLISALPTKKVGPWYLYYSIRSKMIAMLIDRSILDKLSVTIEDVHADAMKNMNPSLIEMVKVLFGNNKNNIMTQELTPSIRSGFLVVSTVDGNKGSSAICREDVCRKIAEVFSTNEFFVLPSSVHELLAIRRDEIPLHELERMVREVNESETITPIEFLSNDICRVVVGEKISYETAVNTRLEDIAGVAL